MKRRTTFRLSLGAGLLLFAALTVAPVQAAHGPHFRSVLIGRSGSVVVRSLPSRAEHAHQAARLPFLRLGRGANRQDGSSPRVAAIGAATGAGTVQVLASFRAVTLDQQVAFAADQFVTPPDNATAAGPNHLVEMVNDSGTIWDKAGNLIKIFDLNAFFAVPSGYTFSDPRLLFDQGSGRWFASGVAFISPSFSSVIVIAVSTSSDPTGTWIQYSADNATNQTHDQPKIGVSDDKVVLSWNDFLNAQFFQGQSTWVFQKSQMVAGTSPVNGSALGPDSSRAAPVPAVQLSPGATAYLVYNNSDCSTLGCNQFAPTLGVVSITGTPLTGVVWNEADPGMAATSQPPNADQPGMPASLATNDDRLLTAVWQNGTLWTGGNDACIPPNDTSTRACSRLIQVSTSGPTITQDFDIASTLGNLYYPALGVDGSNNMFVVYNISSSSQYVGLRITGEQATSPPQTLAPAQTIRAGDASYDMNPCFGTTGPSRWGDYGSAAIDPQDPTSVWVAGEYAANGTATAGDVGCAWGTFAGRLSFVASQPGSTLTLISPASGPAGGGNLVTFNGSGFVSGTTSFIFGANAATGVSCSSATQCQGIAPAGAGQVTVTATVGGQAASGSAVYSYIASLASISPTS